jgi:hypothetical protein
MKETIQLNKANLFGSPDTISLPGARAITYLVETN